MSRHNNKMDRDIQAAQLPLSRVAFVSILSLCIYEIAIRYVASILRGSLRVDNPGRWSKIVYLSLPAQLLFFIAIAIVSISLFSPIKSLFNWQSKGSPNDISTPKVIGLGVVGAAVALTITLLISTSRQLGGILSISLQVSSIVAPSYSMLFFIPIAAFLVGACAVSLEVFIRGVIFRGIATHLNVPVAVAISCLASYLLWPLSNPISGVVISLVSSLLYYWTRTLWPSIVACVSFLTALGPASLLFHRWT